MFEHSLIDLEARKKSRRGWFSLPVAILIHLVAFATFAVAGYWDIAEVPEPPINMKPFIVELPPPPPPIRGSGQPEQKKAEVKPPDVRPVTPQQTVQPEAVPDQAPPVISDVVAAADSGLPDGGHPDGDINGVPDGVIDGVPFSNGDRTNPVTSLIPGPAEPQPANDKPIIVGGAVKKPVAIYQPQPRYTEMARKARVQGMVILDAVIDVNGNVVDLKVRKGQPMGLDQSAMDAVRTWRFRAATLHGQPVKVYFTLTVNFQLN
ncbi:MAG TPA: TonB family protein [Thermoanaerobaculia bacterium]|nr:TonB family protein [Thermoanaerobaculia bacterium]